ncbi:OB-fold domain-containing protein [Actinomadura roseirufa]|uniref:OB-fold domain-containing protein n=1 Tax=Actinomadura roseirufa TaxID=2094049 RepID=UPI001040F3D5|nr:OB-fold domain-containing protein [Actinomadura roseirufa]
MSNIVSAAAYLPSHRLNRKSALAGGRGTRSVAAFDEDSTSMAAEAARSALADLPLSPDQLLFATTSPAYADRTNASVVHAAALLSDECAAYDFVGAVRSTCAALRGALDAAAAGRSSVVVASDIRVGLPGSADESDGGDGSAALVVAPQSDDHLAEVVAVAARTSEIFDRWRPPLEPYSRVWEERFGETAYAPLAAAALQDALGRAGVTAADVDHLIVTGLQARAVRAARAASGVEPSAYADDRSASLGVTGAAHPLLLLTDVLQRAEPGATIVLLVLADGADCFVLRAGNLAGTSHRGPVIADAHDGPSADYLDMLTWRGVLPRATPRRPDPDRPAAPPSLRNSEWKFGFVGSRCLECETRHLPPERICLNCRALDRMAPEPLQSVRGTITTFTVDHLAFSIAPPVLVAVVDLDGGGRFQCELTDADAGSIAVGDRVEFTFRRFYTTADGVHDYFWKARPARAEKG